MKIKNIAVLCKAGKRIHLIDIVDGGGYKQWIGDGNGMYPIVGLPYLNKEEIFTLFDGKFYFEKIRKRGGNQNE